jgi:hypothetical protein
MGFYFLEKAKQEKKIVWCTWTAPLATTYTAQENAIRLTYNRKEVRSIGVSWFMIWNVGKVAVLAKDLSQHNPVRIVATGNTRIISAEPIGSSDPGNMPGAVANQDGKSVLISFEYLNYRHGVMFSVIHTGTGAYLSLAGAVMDAPPLQELDALRYKRSVMPIFVRARSVWAGFLPHRRFPEPIDLEQLSDKRLDPEFWFHGGDSTIDHPLLLF